MVLPAFHPYGQSHGRKSDDHRDDDDPAGKRDEVRALYEELLAPRAVENEGQEVVVWSDDQHDPDTFHLFELYRDMTVMGANAQSPWFAEYLAKVGPMLAGEPKVAMLTPRWSTGV